MAKIKILSEKQVEALNSTGRSNVSGPILADFIGQTDGAVGAVGEVDATSIPGERQTDSLFQMLNQHALTNELPVRAFMRDKKVYLERLAAPRPKPVAKPKAEAPATETASATAVDSVPELV